ncbi:nucleoside triphosphate pyrophosphohydrolase [Alteromonas sp. C1M14]|uniref:nucleoside triphosphate pyrophosphohydrolase n=1 Tax=Alteromonas sp. C1M14 TaxID=2841567 RepID=UPI001C093213|nr:nucleoside triphosphate pyrophosphohydrolase [Alteromonas sp. C1M14]MBU2977668.1 nucleoside triphosphate pyrophosphohydrolase [Alteromonas sp. C1M14]
MSNERPVEATEPMARLLSIMSRLRDPEQGCPWDVAQTMSTLTRYTIEETYEVVDAIASGQPEAICDELGDLLFQIVFYAQIGQEEGAFCFDDVVNGISQKLIRRHPHIFAGKSVPKEKLAAQWDAIKQAERAEGNQPQGLLDTVPNNLPALMYAQKLQKQCAKVGFDWADTAPVLAKVQEEVDEIAEELGACDISAKRVEEEIGDALFAMVNLARHCNVDADTALRSASRKFAARFNQVELLAKQAGNRVEELNLDRLEALWQQVKRNEN